MVCQHECGLVRVMCSSNVWRSHLRVFRASCTIRLCKGNLLSWLRPGSLRLTGLLDLSVLFLKVSLNVWNANLLHQAVVIWRSLLWHVVHYSSTRPLHGAECVKLLLCFSFLCVSVHIWVVRRLSVRACLVFEPGTPATSVDVAVLVLQAVIKSPARFRLVLDCCD